MALSNGNYASPLVLGNDSILEAKDWWKDRNVRTSNEARLSSVGIYGVVFGHDPNAFNVVDELAVADGRLIKIDSGMSPTAGAHLGHFLSSLSQRSSQVCSLRLHTR